MKKNLLKSALLIVLMICGALPSQAAWEVYKSWDFVAISDAGADKAAISYSDETVKLDADCNLGTGDFDGLAFQGANGFMLRNNSKDHGLYNGNGGGRTVGVLGLNAGDKVTITTSGECFSGEGNASLDSYADNVYVYTIAEDGNFNVKMTRYFLIYSITVAKNVVGQGEVAADYTVKYVDAQGNEIKAAETRNGIVGEAITLTDKDKEDVYNEEGVKYIYSSDDETGALVTEGGTVVTVTFREAAVWNYIVKTLNPDLDYIAGTAFEGENVKICYPAYMLTNGKFTSRAPRTSKGEYNETIYIDTNNKQLTLAYVDTDLDNVVFLAEAEDIEGLVPTDGSYAADRCSKGLGAYALEATTITPLEPGKYTLTVSTRGGGARDYGFNFTINGNTVYTTPTLMGYNQTGTSEEFEVSEPTALVVEAAGGKNDMIDYIYIQKTGDVEIEVPAQDLTPIVGTYTVTKFTGKECGYYTDDYMWNDINIGYQYVEIATTENPNEVSVTTPAGFAVVGTVDMEAGTITFEPQTFAYDYYTYLFTNEANTADAHPEWGNGYVDLIGTAPVVASFDADYNISFNGWTLLYEWEDYDTYSIYFKDIVSDYVKGIVEEPVVEPVQDITPLLGNYTITEFSGLECGVYTDDYEWNSFSKSGEIVEVKATENANEVSIKTGAGFNVVGTVDMEARTITFQPQQVALGYEVCTFTNESNIEEVTGWGNGFCTLTGTAPVVATFDEDYNIALNGWGVVCIYDEDYIITYFKNVVNTYAKVEEEEEPQDLSAMVGTYTITNFTGEENGWYTYDYIWTAFSYGYWQVEITATENPNEVSVELPAGYNVVGKVDLEAGTITFEPQTIEIGGYDYLFTNQKNLADSQWANYYVLNGAEPVVAPFDENYNISLNDWTILYYYPSSDVYYSFFRNIVSDYAKGVVEYEEPQDLTPLLGTWYINDFSGKECGLYTQDNEWNSFSRNGEQVEITETDNVNEISIPTGAGFSVVGTVDMEAGTITVETQEVAIGYEKFTFTNQANVEEYSTWGNGYCDVVGNAPVVATFDEEVNTIALNGWTILSSYGSFTTTYLKDVVNTYSRKTTGITDIKGDGNEGNATYYNINGMRIANPAAGQLYIKVQDGKASKVIR